MTTATRICDCFTDTHGDIVRCSVHASAPDLLAVLKELMAWHDCLPTRNICDIEADARRVIAAAEVRS